MKKSETILDTLMRQLRPVVFHVGAVSFFINLLVLPVSIYSLQVMDRVMSTGSIATLVWMTLAMLLLFAAAGFLQSLRGMMLQSVAGWFYDGIAAAVLPLTLAYGVGNRGAQGMRDAGMLKQFLVGNGLTTLLDAPWSLLYIAVLYVIHPLLGILVTVGALLLLVLAWLNESLTHQPLKQAGIQQLQSMQQLEFASRNADVIAGMGMENVLVERWRSRQGDTNTLQSRAGSRASIVQGVTKFSRLSLQILTTCISAWLALDGHITIGAIIASSILASRALAPFEAAISSWKALIETREAYARIQSMLQNRVREEGISLPVPHGQLSVENLMYFIPGQQQALIKQIGFKIEAGDLLGIIGPSGSGKTTLARLMMGVLAPASGVVRLDGADVYSWPREEFGQFTGYLPQDVELFGGTVRDNIARLRQDVSDSDVIEAAQLAGAHELILRLPKGYDTEIGAGGMLLSAGQRQRIGLARAFFGTPRLLVLDEPDANLDDAGREALYIALKQAKLKRITVVVISHRKSILAHADKLLMLRNGLIEAFGPTQQVLAALAAPKQMAGEQRL